MQLPELSKITLDQIHLPELSEKNTQLHILRLDKIHPLISGNKWFKLKYHLETFRAGNYSGILTFGGAWSNHIIATACACFRKKIKCVGVIRGEKPAQLSWTLQEAEKLNMLLKFISREMYRKKEEKEIMQQLETEFPGYYFIPEGGAGPDGEKGAAEILNNIDQTLYTHIACAIGTATMFRGLQKSSGKQLQLIGIPVLKGFNKAVLPVNSRIFYDYHFGGYAKHTHELLSFMNTLYNTTGIPTDFVYTAKLCYAIFDLINQYYFSENSKILVIHSGGLQGNQSLPRGTLIF